MEVPLHRSKHNRSRDIFGRFSENSLHSNYDVGSKTSRRQSCITIMPYATLIATIMCLAGVAVFCGTMYRGALLSALMFDQVFHFQLPWFETAQTFFVILSAMMGALAVMILFIGFLTTGATRNRVYRVWRARVAGRISCIIYMGITYSMQLLWLLIFSFLVIVTFIFKIFWNLCPSSEVHDHRCIDLKQFHFLFPVNTKPEDMEICEPRELKLFCKDYVEKSQSMFIMATFACILVILSLVHYLMCLSANYAHIRDHEKLQELQELQYLQDADRMSSKDRF